MKEDKKSVHPASRPNKAVDEHVEWMADGADLLGSYGWPFVVATIRFVALLFACVFSLFGLNFEDTKAEEAEPAKKRAPNSTGKRKPGK